MQKKPTKFWLFREETKHMVHDVLEMGKRAGHTLRLKLWFLLVLPPFDIDLLLGLALQM